MRLTKTKDNNIMVRTTPEQKQEAVQNALFFGYDSLSAYLRGRIDKDTEIRVQSTNTANEILKEVNDGHREISK